MKITRRDLDSTITEKLDLLDNVISTFDPNNPDGFVSYGKNGFYFKKTNDTFLRKVFTEDELVSLENELGKNTANVRNSSTLDMRCDKAVFNLATKKFLHNISFATKKKFNDTVVLVKALTHNLLILTNDGYLYSNNSETEKSFDLIGTLRSNFNISSELGVYNVIDFAEIDENTIVVATEDFGIYKLSLISASLELITLHTGIRKITVDKTGALFVASREYCARYDLSNGKKIETYKNLAKYFQIPRDLIKTQNSIFVVGDSCGVANMDNLIHCWKLDSDGIGYNLYDNYIARNSIDRDYQIRYTFQTNETFFVAGTYKNDMFVWEYSLESFKLTEKKITCLDNISMDGFIALNDNKFLILSGSIIYLIKNNEVIETLKLPGECKNFYIHRNELLSVINDSLVRLELPKFEAKNEILSFDIYESEETCNNIDILVKGAGRAERISLIDLDTNKEINPSFYAVFSGKAIIKLMNCNAKKIKMLISVNPNSSLDGIVIKRNKMFLR